MLRCRRVDTLRCRHVDMNGCRRVDMIQRHGAGNNWLPRPVWLLHFALANVYVYTRARP